MKLEPITDQNRSFLGDESRMTGRAEEILFPETGEEVCAALRQEGAVTLQGARTGYSGGAVPSGGRILNLSRLTGLGKVERTAAGGRLHAECGVTLEQVNVLAAASGLRFPPDPTEKTATLGGIFSTGAAGPGALGFGPSSRWVEGLDWVTPAGERWQIGRGRYCIHEGLLPLPDGRSIPLPGVGLKTWPEGMDLIDFLAGTEGYLGAAVSMELTLIPRAGDLWGVVFFFRNPEDVPMFGQKLLGRKGLTAGEYYGEGALALLDAHRDNPLLARLPAFPEGAKAALYVELEGDSEEETTDALMELLDLFALCGGSEEDTWAENGPDAVRKFRDMRHAVPSILNELPALHDPETGLRWELNLSGTPEEFPARLALYRKEAERAGISCVLYGSLLLNRLRAALLPEREEQHRLCGALVRRLTEQAVDGEGLAVTEYEVGKSRRSLLSCLLSAEEQAALCAFRKQFDPDLKMNP